MSLTVINPRNRPSASTTGSFSILCRSRVGNGVHLRGGDRDLDLERAGETRRGRDVVREDAGLSRDEQDVVEGQPFARELAVELDEAFQLRLVEVQTLHPLKITNGPDGSRL